MLVYVLSFGIEIEINGEEGQTNNAPNVSNGVSKDFEKNSLRTQCFIKTNVNK